MTNALAFIIEDDLNLSQAYAQALNEADYSVEVYRDGQKAANRLEEITPDTIILDLHIPQVSGLKILEIIENNDRHSHTRIIVTTADDRKADDLRARVDLVLIKPVGFQQLRDMARRMLPKQ